MAKMEASICCSKIRIVQGPVHGIRFEGSGLSFNWSFVFSVPACRVGDLGSEVSIYI